MKKIEKADMIWGSVMDVIDGDTFALAVTNIGDHNRYTYDATERIRIASVDAPELPSKPGADAKSNLERKIKGKTVRCEIQARDDYGRLVCDVALVIP